MPESSRTSSAQDRTLEQYYSLMQINASAHILRAARDTGIFGELHKGQRTLTQLAANLSLDVDRLELLLDALVAISIVEQYAEDFALSRAGQLMFNHDGDFGESTWQPLSDLVRDGDRAGHDQREAARYLSATQWIHTPAAMQAAEILDIGGDDSVQDDPGDGDPPGGMAMLDLGCGAGVWSCAMAHRDRASTVLAVDFEDIISAAQQTADSIELGERFETLPGDPSEVELPADRFDLAVTGQRLHLLGDAAIAGWLARAVAATRPGGRVVVIDLFRGPTRPMLAESVEALKLDLITREGRMRTLPQTQTAMREAGLEAIQFTFLAAARVNLGMAVGTKPDER